MHQNLPSMETVKSSQEINHVELEELSISHVVSPGWSRLGDFDSVKFFIHEKFFCKISFLVFVIVTCVDGILGYRHLELPGAFVVVPLDLGILVQ